MNMQTSLPSYSPAEARRMEDYIIERMKPPPVNPDGATQFQIAEAKRNAVMAVLRQHGPCTVADVSARLEMISGKQIGNALARLSFLGRVRRSGPHVGGKWEVAE